MRNRGFIGRLTANRRSSTRIRPLARLPEQLSAIEVAQLWQGLFIATAPRLWPRCVMTGRTARSYQIHSSRRYLRAAFRETSVLPDNLIETYRIPPRHARSCSSRRSTRPMPRLPAAFRCHYALVGHHLLFLQRGVVERAIGSKGASSCVRRAECERSFPDREPAP